MGLTLTNRRATLAGSCSRVCSTWIEQRAQDNGVRHGANLEPSQSDSHSLSHLEHRLSSVGSRTAAACTRQDDVPETAFYADRCTKRASSMLNLQECRLGSIEALSRLVAMAIETGWDCISPPSSSPICSGYRGGQFTRSDTVNPRFGCESCCRSRLRHRFLTMAEESDLRLHPRSRTPTRAKIS